MLLKLISLPTQPTIHYSLALPTFPSHLDPPQAYAAQINHLLTEDLEIPDTLYSLDRSVGLMSLLDQVVFEIKDSTGDGDGDGGGGNHNHKTVRVTCQFVDGALEEWATEGTHVISALESIIHNVQESTLEDHKEREHYQQSQLRSCDPNRLTMPPGPTPMTGTKPKHKRQRSLFMQIVSSIVNLTSPSSSSPSHLPTFVDPSHPQSFYSSPPSNSPAPTPSSSNRARFLRQTARSNLVNTYRRFVLPELTRRFPKEGGFCVWILHSMRRRAWERMEDLIREGNRLHQQVLEVRQRHDEERQQEQILYQQERAKSPILVDEQPFVPRFTLDESGLPFSFFDEGGSTENENESANFSRNNSEEDDLETITDDSSVHTPSPTSHIGPGFMGGEGSSPTSPTTAQALKSSPSNSRPCLPEHFLLEYDTLSRLRQRLHTLILFGDSHFRIAEEEQQNRDEILLVRGRRRAWLNGELARGIGVAATGMMQWGFAAPFKSSPLARYSWTELDEDTCPQQDVDEEYEDEYDGSHAIRDCYPHGRQSRRSRYSNGEAGKLPPVTEEVECETLDLNPNGNGFVQTLENPSHRREDSSFLHLQDDEDADSSSDGLSHPLENPFHRREDSSFLHLQEDEDADGSSEGFSQSPQNPSHRRDDSSFLHLHEEEDADSSSDGFSLVDLDLELGFGLHDPTSFIGEDGDINRCYPSEKVGVEEFGQKEGRRGETSRIAFDMERPKIIPRVRDGLGDTDDDSITVMAVGTSSRPSTFSRNGGRRLSWGYWKNNGVNGDVGADGAVKRYRGWKNGIGIGLGGRGRSLNKTWQRGLEDAEPSRRRVSMSSTASTTFSSNSQKQNEPAQVHQSQDQDSSTTPILCQPVSFSVHHIVPAQPPSTLTSSSPTTVAILSPDANTPASPNDITENPEDTTCTPGVPTNSPKTSFVPIVPLSSTTKKVCITSPAPNVHADIDISVVHEDEQNLDRGFGGGESVSNPGAVSHATSVQAQGHAPRLRPRRHKREYQYQYPRQRQYQRVYGNGIFNGQDECDEFELFSGGSAADFFSPNSKYHHHPQPQQRHNSMIHARLHLDELLLEESMFKNGCHDVTDQEEFTLAMDVPLSGRGRHFNVLKKQYLRMRQNRDSAGNQEQEKLDQQQHEVRTSAPSSSQATMNGLSEGVRESQDC